MFNSRHTWELVDPGQFDTAVLGDRKNFSLRNEFFTNSTAYGINARRVREFHPYLGALYAHLTSSAKEHAKKELHEKLKDSIGTIDVARGTTDIPSMYEIPLSLPRGFNLLCEVAQERCKPLLFVSDIRSGSLDLPNFEEHVQENMKAQECWTQLLNGKYSMLKFRLPYTWVSVAGESKPVRNTTTIREDGTVPYLRGEILLPIWTRPTSTEGRLVVPQDAFQVPYNVEKVEDQFFYFNSRMREQFHFNHVVRNNDYLDHHYDATAEVRCLQEYLRFTRPELKGASDEVISSEVIKISNRITACLKVSFEDAIRRRDALVLRQAAQNAPKNTDTHGKTTLADVVRALVAQGTVERERAVWKENMDETQAYDSPKEWVKS
ncbi:hypothetical protein AGDE_10184 [Angomonas deanei]|nr:hypothetical protein AGDE_10184 [Angomonas deanei]|eukprot:EPY28983.1 hypothetical protein AGDE_10184 [Angomonas deanei]